MRPGSKKLIAYAAFAAGLLGCAIAVAAALGFFAGGSPSTERLAAELASSPRIEVKGRVKGIYPGATKQMDVRVSNAYPHAVRLVSVRVRDADANATCTSEYLNARRFQGRVRIGPSRTEGVRMQVRMEPTAPDSCQGASFPLRFRARVTE